MHKFNWFENSSKLINVFLTGVYWGIISDLITSVIQEADEDKGLLKKSDLVELPWEPSTKG